MADEFGERTEAPTSKRKRDAVEQGDVLKSREFATALVILAGCGWLALMGPSLVAACKAVMASSFAFDHRDLEDFSPFRPLAASGWKLAPALVSLFAITLVAAILSQAGLGHLGFNGKLLAPKASRINPGAGLKRIAGPQGWIELGKALMKVALLGGIGWYMLARVAHQSIGLASTDIGTAVATLGNLFTATLFAMAGGLVLIAGVDVPVQILQLLRKLRMSKQQIRDETKETEGSPEAKSAQRQRRQQMATRNMRKAVSEAHVILTNPTHFAVALRYDRASDQVPLVVAKGARRDRARDPRAGRRIAGAGAGISVARPRGLLHQPRGAGGARRPVCRARDRARIRVRGEYRRRRHAAPRAGAAKRALR